jgi:uncharacterized membrane protein
MAVVAITLHVLAVIVWVGGLFLGFMALRPTLNGMDTLQAARIWAGVLGRFLPWVWGAIAAILASGVYMVFNSYDGFAHVPWFVQFMMGVGLMMMAAMGHLTFAPFKRLKGALARDDAAVAAKAMRQIRIITGVALALGVAVVIVIMSGAYFSTD